VATSVALFGLGAGLALLLSHIMNSDARVIPAPSPVDIGFAQDMSVHHSQAIEMADIVGMNPDPTLASLAQRIKTTQAEELGRMQGYLSLWDAPTLPSGPPMTWMTPDMRAPQVGMHADHHSMAPETAGMDDTMPGMATQSQLARLRSLEGRDQEVLFLQLMLRHHQGGVAMAGYAASHAALPQTQSLAARMSFDQQQENQIISQLLVQLGVDSFDPPA
jgi:uncharacterized protein (DUF305 family)